MRVPTVDPKNAIGFIDKLTGLGKEFAGEVLGNDRLIEAGEAQQDKGTERLKSLRAQAEADAHEVKAQTYENQEKAAQRAKVS